jgi:hypothetical protein
MSWALDTVRKPCFGVSGGLCKPSSSESFYAAKIKPLKMGIIERCLVEVQILDKGAIKMHISEAGSLKMRTP